MQPRRSARFGLVFRVVGLTVVLGLAYPPAARAQALDPTPPAETVKLIFIHHSSGENWLTDGNGNLGRTLGENNYFVSDTNYGWGPDGIGDTTDIVDWPRWFRSDQTETYLGAVYAESGQNSNYTRTLADPGGENQIVMFKSCFPNSELEGSPTDPPAAGDGLTVSNAKFIYTDLLKYFATRPDKLFIVITAPPLIGSENAANARAFNLWLVNDWLAENHYTLPNVAVWDFYNVLTGADNHHRYADGQIEYITDRGGDTSYSPSAPDDDHPSEEVNRKATEEFIPMLNIFYHRWQAAGPLEPPPASAPTATAPALIAPAPQAGNMIDNFDGAVPPDTDGWQAYWDTAVPEVAAECAVDSAETYQNSPGALRLEFDLGQPTWVSCNLAYAEAQDWSGTYGLGFVLNASKAGQPFAVGAYGGSPDNLTTYHALLEAPGESSSAWVPMVVAWDQIVRVDWEEQAGTPFDPQEVLGVFFSVAGEQEQSEVLTLLIDDLWVVTEPEAGPTTESLISPAASPTPASAGRPTDLPPHTPVQTGSGGLCAPAPLAAVVLAGLVWGSRRTRKAG